MLEHRTKFPLLPTLKAKFVEVENDSPPESLPVEELVLLNSIYGGRLATSIEFPGTWGGMVLLEELIAFAKSVKIVSSIKVRTVPVHISYGDYFWYMSSQYTIVFNRNIDFTYGVDRFLEMCRRIITETLQYMHTDSVKFAMGVKEWKDTVKYLTEAQDML